MRIDMKRMQLKTFGFVMMLGLMIGAKSQAQLAMSFKSASQQLIEDAVKEGVLLYRQDYLLEDSSGSRFTLDNQACVGKASGFCVLLDDGYVVPRSLLEPWKGDDVYEPYAGQYKAVVSASWRRSVEDARWVEAGILQARDKADLLSGTWCQAQDSLFRGKGFAIDAEPGRKEGWLVWLAADMATALDSAKLDMFKSLGRRLPESCLHGRRESGVPFGRPGGAGRRAMGLAAFGIVPNRTDQACRADPGQG